MEILRTVGIEQIVRRKSDEQFVQDGAIMAVETLAGKELAWFIANLNEGVRDVSPCERVFISQSLLEPLLRTRAEELGARLLFGTDMISFEADPDGVTAVVRGGTTARRIRFAHRIAGRLRPVEHDLDALLQTSRRFRLRRPDRRERLQHVTRFDRKADSLAAIPLLRAHLVIGLSGHRAIGVAAHVHGTSVNRATCAGRTAPKWRRSVVATETIFRRSAAAMTVASTNPSQS